MCRALSFSGEIGVADTKEKEEEEGGDSTEEFCGESGPFKKELSMKGADCCTAAGWETDAVLR